MEWVLGAGVVLVLLLGIAHRPTLISAQTEAPRSINIVVEAGFDGAYRVQQWFPVLVTLTNDGQDVRGLLQWAFPAQEGQGIYQQTIELPRGARKQVRMNVMSTGFVRNGEVQVVDEDGSVIAKQGVALEPIDQGQFTIGVMSSDTVLLNSLLAMNVNGSSNMVTLFRIQASTIPEETRALDGLDVLVLHEMPEANGLSEAQQDTIERWVQLGGQLVLSGGGTETSAMNAFADLLPVTVEGVEAEVSLVPLGDFLDDAALTQSLPTKVTISRVTPKPGAQSHTPDNLITSMPFGAGQVIFSAFDLRSLRGWSGEPLLWEQIFRTTPVVNPALHLRVSNSELISQVVNFPEMWLLPLIVLVLFIVGYILIIGPINFAILNRIKRPELAWGSIPAIVVVFVLGTYILGSQMRGSYAQVFQIDIVQGFEDDPRGYITSSVGVFSPVRDFYTVTTPGVMSLMFPTSYYAQRSEVVQWDDTSTHLRDMLIDVSSLQTMMIEQAVVNATPAVRSTIQRNGWDVEVTVENRGMTPLSDAMLVYGNSMEELGTIQPGEQRTTTLAYNQSNFPDGIFQPLGVADTDGVFNRPNLLNVLFGQSIWWSIQVPTAPMEGLELPETEPTVPPPLNIGMPDHIGVYLLTWDDQGTANIQLNQASQHQGITLYTIRLAGTMTEK